MLRFFNDRTLSWRRKKKHSNYDKKLNFHIKYVVRLKSTSTIIFKSYDLFLWRVVKRQDKPMPLTIKIMWKQFQHTIAIFLFRRFNPNRDFFSPKKYNSIKTWSYHSQNFKGRIQTIFIVQWFSAKIIRILIISF